MNRLPPFRLLNVFETVLRAGGVKQAAGELNVSQPAVSQSLRQLETHVGVPLLDRSTRPAGLTEAGMILHRAAEENTERLQQALADIEALSGRASNTVTVACTLGLATNWIMPRLEAFYQDHGDIAVNVLASQDGTPPLAPGTDIALRFGNGKWRDGESRLLFEERIEPVCAPSLAARIAHSGGHLGAAFLIHVDFADKRWMTWPEYLARAGLTSRGSDKGLRFTNYVQATQAALSGHGVMLGWRSITGDSLAAGHLVPVLDAPVIPESAYYAVISEPRRRHPPAEIFMGWLEQATADLHATA